MTVWTPYLDVLNILRFKLHFIFIWVYWMPHSPETKMCECKMHIDYSGVCLNSNSSDILGRGVLLWDPPPPNSLSIAGNRLPVFPSGWAAPAAETVLLHYQTRGDGGKNNQVQQHQWWVWLRCESCSSVFLVGVNEWFLNMSKPLENPSRYLEGSLEPWKLMPVIWELSHFWV